MKQLLLLTALITTLCTGALAQSSKNKSVYLDSGTRVNGELQSTVDVKRSKVGDEVVLKTTRSISQNGRTVVPKGSKLIGRITDVQQKSRSNAQSRLGIVFDRIEGKNLSSPINATVVSIVNTRTNTGVADSDVFASTTTSTQTTGSSGGGGLLGGVTSSVGSVVNTTATTLGSVADTTGRTAGSTIGTAGRTLSGIQISNSINGSAQSGSTLSAANRNIRLEKGVMIQLELNNSVRAD